MVAADAAPLYPCLTMQRMNRTALAAVLASAVSVTAGSAIAYDEPDLPFRFGEFAGEIAGLDHPTAVAIDGDGLIYVIESGAHRVSIFDRIGQPLRRFGTFGRQPGELAFPTGLAVIGAGDDAQIVVTDSANDRVQTFAPNGRFIRGWGGRGAEPGQFNRPTGIAIDNDLVLIADEGNNRVQLLNHDGTVLKVIGGPGVGDGQFTRPAGVTFDVQRNIYVADADNNRVQSFDLDGEFLAAWGDYGPFAGLMDEPLGLTARDQRIFVADSRNHRVQVFTLDGEPVYQWGVHARLPRQGSGALHYPVDIAIAPSGDVAAICETFEDRVQLFNVAPPDVAEADAGTPFQPRPNQTHFGTRLSLAANLLAIAEPETHTVYLYRIDREIPIHVTTHTGRGRAPHQFIRMADLELAVDPVTLLVADTAMARIQQFNLDYDPNEELAFRPLITNLSRAFDLAYFSDTILSGELRWPIEPAAIERDADGNLHIVDPRNAMVHVFDAGMNHLRSIGAGNAGPGRLRRPNDIAFSSDGQRTFVVDGGDRFVKVFDSNGALLRAFDASDSAGGAFVVPFGIEAGTDGFVYVTDAGSHRVLKFDGAGRFVAQWGGKGSDDGQLWKPGGIEQASDGRLYIADYGNHRVQIFRPDGQWLVSFGLGKPTTRQMKQEQAAEQEAME